MNDDGSLLHHDGALLHHDGLLLYHDRPGVLHGVRWPDNAPRRYEEATYDDERGWSV
jgi:hypothetical protein